MSYVNKPVRKKDAMALVTGQPVYTDDLAPKDCLVVKVLRSPHAHAWIEEIRTENAMKVPGIACILTYEDVPQDRFTMAGQTYPEFSPYDRLILDRRMRFVGDAAAIVAGETEKAVDRALKIIKVKYKVLEPVLDFHKAKDNAVCIHPEDNWESRFPVGADNKRNLCAHAEEGDGDVEKILADCDCVVERTYHTKANQQAMMETFRSYTYMDHFGRLNIVSSTQVPFHIRRMVANALELPKSQIKVIKPRIGGGFGAKQTGCTEIFTAFVTWKLKKPCKLVYTREETFMASNSRHEMKMHVKIGAMKDGEIRAIDLYTLSNTGAYGEHGSTTVGLSGHKSLPIYNHVKASRFVSDVVYTNTMTAGAYRGYGATQGQFAVESAVNELADTLHIDPCELRLKNMVQEDEVMKQYYGEHLNSCALDRCLRKAMDMIGWKEKALCRDMGDKVRGLGVALSMQGSGIANVDIASTVIKLQDDGFYTLSIGATDMGTGCDTILAQMAAECLDCDVDNIITQSVEDDKEITLAEFANRCFAGGKGACLIASASHCSPTSPPPFMAGIAEVDVDKLTGEITLVDYAAVVDCGTVINPNLARIQTEGGIAQGIGMALYEDITYSCKGRMRNNSFLQYKMPTRQDVGTIRVDFESSYEDNGPFGAKSIGEVVINTPAPAIASAVAHASGVQVRTLPITAEKVLLKKDED